MKALSLLLACVVPLLHLWALAALWIDGPESRLAAGGLLAVYIASLVGCAVLTRRMRPALATSVIPFVIVLLWWFSLAPSNDRDWMEDVAELPWAQIEGDQLTIHNLRNFDYQSETDYTPHWERRTYDLSELRGVDLFLSTWGSPLIAHTIASWDFGDGNQLAISIETRKEKSESYSAILGFFRQYEIYYVVADERDVVRLRTNYRGEQVRIYRLSPSADEARAILIDYLEEINSLADKPLWYNALAYNCTTAIRHHVKHIGRGGPFDWRILVNGKIDEMGYERGTIDTSLPFEELRRVSNINARAQAADDAADFSERIRVGLPGARAPLSRRPAARKADARHERSLVTR